MDALFGLILIGMMAVITWCVASEGAWGASLTFLCVLFAGLLTMNFFEPIAAFLEDKGGNMLAPYADLIAFVGLFAGLTFLGRLATDTIAPTDIEMDGRVQQVVRWLLAAATGYVTVAILLTAMHTAPLPRKFIGFRPEGDNLFEFAAPDRQWLGFVQHVSERVLTTGRIFDGPRGTFEGTDQRVWPSFPIRYATRRDDIASGAIKRPSSAAGGGAAPAPATGAPSF